MNGMQDRTGFDIRLFEKPKAFSGQEAGFAEFRLKLLAYLDMMDEHFAEEVEAAEQHGGPIAVPTEDGTARRGRALYALLVGLLSGRGMKVLQGVAQRNGFEAWRQVVGEFTPRIVQIGRTSACVGRTFEPGDHQGGPHAVGALCERV